MAWSTVLVAKTAPRSLLDAQARRLPVWRCHDPPRTRDTRATENRQFDAAPLDRIGEAVVGDAGDEDLEAGGDGVADVDAAEATLLGSSDEHPVMTSAAMTSAATPAPSLAIPYSLHVAPPRRIRDRTAE